MALEGPQLIYAREVEDEETGDALARALHLAREVEELLDEVTTASREEARGVHATRIVRAMATSLVDELEAIVRGTRKSGLA
jgi:hypothetical protein